MWLCFRIVSFTPRANSIQKTLPCRTMVSIARRRRIVKETMSTTRLFPWPSVTQRSSWLVQWHHRLHWLVGGPECSSHPMRNRHTCIEALEIIAWNWTKEVWGFEEKRKLLTWTHSPRPCSSSCLDKQRVVSSREGFFVWNLHEE